MHDLQMHFLLPGTVSTEQFIAGLNARMDMQELARRQVCVKTYYDSFDGRLYDADIACLTVQEGQSLRLLLIGLKSAEVMGEASIVRRPVFAGDIGDAQLRGKIAEVLEMRALLPVLTETFTGYAYAVVDKRRKTVARLSVEAFETRTHIHLRALKGYGKALAKWTQVLQQEFGLIPEPPASLIEALREQRHGRYSYKLHLSLEEGMRADAAGKEILKRLLELIKSNEQGVIENTDSEFLHDFRVAVRKTRAALGQLKGIFPEPAVQRFRDYFSWLGKVTGPARDLDVYLLNFDGYKNSLPAAIREDLNPLYAFLAEKHRQAQLALAEDLRSQRFKEGLAEWERFLHQAPDDEAFETAATTPVKDFAARRIWRVYRRVLREGNAINDASSPEALHEVRKTCKKLRYLMEFFQSVFPAENIAALIKTLKSFQEVLGNFQDYHIQEERLRHFSAEMLDAAIPAETFLAMGVLIQHLDELRCSARAEFAERFADFQNAGHREAFASLFAPEKNRSGNESHCKLYD